jgi:hypothetical protein
MRTQVDIGIVLAAGVHPAQAAGAPATGRVGQTGARSAIEITSCREIAHPGAYVLTADLEAAAGGDCIRVLASDVAIDLNGHSIRGTDSATAAGINANATRADRVAIRNGRISRFWVGAVVKSGTVESVRVDDVGNGLYVGYGAVVANTVSAAHTGIQVHRARVEGNAIETAATAILCNLSCFATENIVNGAPAIDEAASGAVAAESATSL